MNASAPSVFIFSGEQSADIHGSLLTKSLLETHPEIKISGIGGEKLKNAGVNIIRDNSDLGVVGFWEVLKQYGKFKSLLNYVVDYIKENKIDLLILIDYPGFNLRLAKALKNEKVKIVYYISPQIWAWGKNRINIVKECVDHVIVIFNFEEKIYEKESVPVSFVGHPLVDSLKSNINTDELDDFLGEIKKEDKLIALLPGSRKNEVKNHLPIFLDFAKNISKDRTDIKFVISSASKIRYQEIVKINNEFSNLNKCSLVPVYQGDVNEVINKSDFIILVSGTVSLQAAYYKKPMVVVYKVNPFSYLIIKSLIKTKFISLVNIVAEQYIVPELIQSDCSSKNIEQYILEWINNESIKEEMVKKLTVIKEKLGEPGASKRAGQIIGKMIYE